MRVENVLTDVISLSRQSVKFAQIVILNVLSSRVACAPVVMMSPFLRSLRPGQCREINQKRMTK